MPGTRKLGKPTDQRIAMLRQLVTDFLDKGRMETTITRAKEIRPIAEKMITLGKKNTLASRRDALAFLTREDVVTKLFAEIAPKYDSRQGGYCRIVRIGPRRGDGAEMAVIALVEEEARAARPAPVLTAPAPATPEELPETVTELEAEIDPVDAVDAEAAEVEAEPEADAEAEAETEENKDEK